MPSNGLGLLSFKKILFASGRPADNILLLLAHEQVWEKNDFFNSRFRDEKFDKVNILWYYADRMVGFNVFNQKTFMGILEKIDIICLILDTDSFIEKLLNRSFLITFH